MYAVCYSTYHGHSSGLEHTNPWSFGEGNGQDLSTVVLDLPYVNSYPLDPDWQAQAQARPVVALLQQLHEGETNRTENPVIAAYAGRRLDKTSGENLYEDQYTRAVAKKIVELAQEDGMHVVVKKEEDGMTLYGEDPADEALLSAASEKGILRGAARWVAARLRSTGEAERFEPKEPDFRLSIGMHVDEASYSSDYRGGAWSYQQMITKISVLPPASIAHPSSK